MRRTSLTHPLRIDAVKPGDGLGRIGITFCPGKYDPHAQTGSWDRDLALDLDAIKRWGAAAVVSLVTDQELKLLRVPHLGDEVRRRNMSWYHLPILDASTPDDQFETSWKSAGPELRSLLNNRENVLVHCRGGLGRAGTIAAKLLVEFGMEPNAAIDGGGCSSLRSARARGAPSPRDKDGDRAAENRQREHGLGNEYQIAHRKQQGR
jgi:ADP-ribosyl-[dinitrogen reductase] hydrolase